MSFFSQRVSRIQPSPTISITAKAKKLKQEGKKIIDFSAGEPDFDTPDNVKDAGIKAIKEGQTKYTPVNGTKELNEAIIKKFKRENNLVFNPEETAENLKKNGGFIPGIRPGNNTSQYLDFILTRLTVVGAIYLVAVAILPELLIARLAVPFFFGGTSLLIVVSVTLDTVAQVQSHLLAHQYEGLIKKSRLKGRR